MVSMALGQPLVVQCLPWVTRAGMATRSVSAEMSRGCGVGLPAHRALCGESFPTSRNWRPWEGLSLQGQPELSYRSLRNAENKKA